MVPKWKEGLEDNAIEAIENIVKGKNILRPNISVSQASKKGDNYMGIMHRLTVSGARRRESGDEEEIEWTFILKMRPSYIRQIHVDVMYKKELLVYTEMMPYFAQMEIDNGVPEEKRFRFPACLAGDLTPLKEFIVFDDLKAENFVMGSRKESLTHDQMVLLIRSLAKVHSFSFAMKKRDPEKFRRFTDAVFVENEYDERFKKFLVMMCNKAIGTICDEDVKERLRIFAEGIGEKMVTFTKPDAGAPYSVLCHGDCWTNNVMFKYKNNKPVEARILDWQVIRYSSPLIDLAFLIFTSTDENLREKHYYELLDLYYDHLQLCLKLLGCDITECYPETAFKDHIVRFMPFGLLMAILTALLFVWEENEVKDMSQIIKMGEEGIVLQAKSQERYEKRIGGVVKDFIKYKLL